MIDKSAREVLRDWSGDRAQYYLAAYCLLAPSRQQCSSISHCNGPVRVLPRPLELQRIALYDAEGTPVEITKLFRCDFTGLLKVAGLSCMHREHTHQSREPMANQYHFPRPRPAFQNCNSTFIYNHMSAIPKNSYAKDLKNVYIDLAVQSD